MGCKSKNYDSKLPTSIVSEIKDAFSIKNVAKYLTNHKKLLFSII